MPPRKKTAGEDRGSAKASDKGLAVRLALGADVVKTVGEKAFGPQVRLAVTIEGGKESSPVGEEAMARHLAPSVRLAHVPGAQGDNNLLGQRGVEQLPVESAPALLVSYVYLPQFLENRSRYSYRDWVLDSGAFSAHNSGTEIILQDYINCCKELLASDPTLTEVFALDVIGDWKTGVKNCEEMWKQGVHAIPAFHYGEPWDLLKGLAKDYPKIALGGCVGKRDKDKFAGQCFARVWPKKIHGFGFGSEKSLMLYPWHSVDATNWEIGPCKYGRWAAFGNASISVRGSKQNLRAEVEWYLELERKARVKWKKEMALLAGVEPIVRLDNEPNSGGGKRAGDALSVRLVANAHQGREEAKATAFGPTIRLVGAADDVTDRRPIAFTKRDKEQIRPRKIKRSKK